MHFAALTISRLRSLLLKAVFFFSTWSSKRLKQFYIEQRRGHICYIFFVFDRVVFFYNIYNVFLVLPNSINFVLPSCQALSLLRHLGGLQKSQADFFYCDCCEKWNFFYNSHFVPCFSVSPGVCFLTSELVNMKEGFSCIMMITTSWWCRRNSLGNRVKITRVFSFLHLAAYFMLFVCLLGLLKFDDVVSSFSSFRFSNHLQHKLWFTFNSQYTIKIAVTKVLWAQWRFLCLIWVAWIQVFSILPVNRSSFSPTEADRWRGWKKFQRFQKLEIKTDSRSSGPFAYEKTLTIPRLFCGEL